MKDNEKTILELTSLLNCMVETFATKIRKSKRIHKELQTGIVFEAIQYLDALENE